MEIYIFNFAVVDAVKTIYKDPFEPVYEKGIHAGAILSTSICPARSILSSLAEDKTLKLWDFANEG